MGTDAPEHGSADWLVGQEEYEEDADVPPDQRRRPSREASVLVS